MAHKLGINKRSHNNNMSREEGRKEKAKRKAQSTQRIEERPRSKAKPKLPEKKPQTTISMIICSNPLPHRLYTAILSHTGLFIQGSYTGFSYRALIQGSYSPQ